MRIPRVAKAAVAAAPEPPASTRRAARDKEFENALGARIRSARLAAGMSQGDLGEAAGISYQQIQKYENGKDRLAVNTLRSLAAALGVRPGSFLDDEAPVPSGTAAEIREAHRLGSRVLAIKDPGAIRLVMALADRLAAGGTGGLPGRESPEMAK